MGLCSSTDGQIEEKNVSQEASIKKARLFVTTWNVGNAAPDDLTPLFPKEACDLIVVGAQECDYKARGGYNSCHADWIGSLSKALGNNYELVGSHNLMQMRIAAFAHQSFKNHISNVMMSTEATGVGGVVGNKGGVVISFNVHDTRICFVNSHLAAHQDKTAKRNADVAEIIQGIALGEKDVDILHQFHHVFWLGDLNYRLNYGNQGDEKSPSQEVFDGIVQKIEQKQYDDLFQYDQLAEERKKGAVFAGFQEGEYNFPPTFKVERGQQLKYKDQRSPAWCDRILWKTLPGVPPLKQTLFNTCLDISSSDHKPVYGIFDLDYFELPARSVNNDRVSIEITNLRGHDLPAGDLNNLSDPYIIFVSDVLKKEYKTKTIMQTINPNWNDGDVPVLELNASNRARLNMSFITLKVFDYDATSGDDLLANGLINLCEYEDRIGKGPFPFKVWLRRSGLPAGDIQGTMNIVVKH